MSKILIVNWTWYPSGGDWTYIECLIKFYESKGHEVIPFSMHNEKNFETPYSKYFISGVDYKELNKNKSLGKGLQAVKRTIYSSEAKHNLAKLLDEHKIDIVHLNNIHHYLTPASIIPEIKKRNIPIVWTIHDYVILCANTTFVSNGTVCEKCRGGKFINCAINKCKKGSRAASIVAAMESYTNNWMNPYKHVDYFIFPSNFIKNKFDSFGFHKDRLVQIYNMFDLDTIKYTVPENPIKAERDYITYVGNTLRVKGIFTLVDAMKGLDVDLYVIGDGEHFNELKEYIAANELHNVKLLGRKTKNDVFYYVANSLFKVLPTIMYENLPYSIMECALLGRPSVGARTGGIPELIVEGKSGYLFEPGNVADCRAKIELMLSKKDQLTEMGRIGKEHVMNLVTPEAFEKKIAPIFQSLNVNL
ncbi:MAG: glycosyltransferase family 4 protein [Chitinophagaceae bacterium]